MPFKIQDLEILGAQGKVTSKDDFLDGIRDFLGNSPDRDAVLLQFLNADYICGRGHIVSSIEHALRAFEQRKNISSTLALEILLYCAGEPQINMALGKVGITNGCQRYAVIVGGISDKDGMLDFFGLKRDDTILECSKEKLLRFGIDEKEIAALGESRLSDLILERVAMVDVRK